MSLKEKTVSGVKWQAVSVVFNTMLAIVKYAVLTRLLDKSDFGLVAVALMIISFTEIFSQLGMTVGIIHKQNITEKQFSSVYWLNVMASVAVFLMLWALTPALAVFYSEPILKKIIPLLGLQILFNGFGKMFQTVKTKEMEFGFLSKVQIVVSLINFGVTVLTAWYGLGVYSLVIGQITSSLLNQGVFAIRGLKQQKILFHFQLSDVKEFVQIGVYQLGSSVLDFVSSKIDVFLIGKFFGMDALGVYNIAKDLISRPYALIRNLINSVASSAFAKIQDNMNAVQSYYKYLIKVVSSTSAPIYAGMLVFADFIVSILYAPEFADVAVFIRIMSFVGFECCISGLAGTLQTAFGRTDIGFKWTVLRIIFTIGAILISSLFNIKAVAYSQLIISFVSVFLYWYLVVYKLSFIKIVEYLRSFILPLLVVSVISIPFFILQLQVECNVWLNITMCISFAILYCLYFFLFQRNFVVEIIGMFIPKAIKKNEV